ncbi:MAG: CDP-diacylglycerol--glycerol-3-phosphate 3-phosphatidyltransferase [Verrucomicrobiota bacterium]
MTLANRITIFRILLIPVFVGFAVYYGASLANNTPEQSLRLAAIITFIVAAASDGVDGFIARRFNQKTRLGVLLDPLADKTLVVSAIITLSIMPWEQKLPLWFPILVIFRDAVSGGAYFLLVHFTKEPRVQPHWTGKSATFFQMLAIAWVMLDITAIPLNYPVFIAGFFTFASGMIYLADCIRQLQQSGHAHPDS